MKSGGDLGLSTAGELPGGARGRSCVGEWRAIGLGTFEQVPRKLVWRGQRTAPTRPSGSAAYVSSLKLVSAGVGSVRAPYVPYGVPDAAPHDAFSDAGTHVGGVRGWRGGGSAAARTPQGFEVVEEKEREETQGCQGGRVTRSAAVGKP